MKNEYKPGQLITIDNHIYRVVKRTTYYKSVIAFGKLTTIEVMCSCVSECALRTNCSKYCNPSAYHRNIPNCCCFKLIK